MKKTQVTLTVKMKCKPGHSPKLYEAAKNLLTPTRAEAGCIDYYFHVSNDDPDICFFYENWADQDSLDKHSKMPYITAFQKSIEELLAQKPEFMLWQMLE